MGMWETALSQETARTAPLLPPEEGWVENHLFCSAAGSTANGNHIVKERAISFSSEFSGSWTDRVRCTASSLSPTTPPLASGQETVVGKRNATPRISGQCLRGRGEFCCDQSEPNAFCAIQLDSPPLNHRRYVNCPFGVTYGVLRRGFHYPTHPAGSSTQSDFGVAFEQVSRHVVVTMDASRVAGALHAASGFWTGPRLLWHIQPLLFG